MAMAYLDDAGQGDDPLRGRVPAASLAIARRLIHRRFNAPLTSSVGRLFDGVAALAGVRDRVSYEGQAAIELEWLASEALADGHYPFEVEEAGADRPLVIDTRPMIAEVAVEVGRGRGAAIVGRRFHSTLVEIVAAVCSRIRSRTGLGAVVLSGGVFLNALLLREAIERLGRDGFRVYRHRRVPPSDGGLSLGQLAIAAACDMHDDSTPGGGPMAPRF
jgi:hydrogenase maturation protein HypF